MPDSTALVMPPSCSTSSISFHGGVRERLREGLDVVRAAERVDHVRDAGFLGEDQLGVARRRAAAKSLGSAIASSNAFGVQALRPAEHGGASPRRRCARRCCTGPVR